MSLGRRILLDEPPKKRKGLCTRTCWSDESSVKKDAPPLARTTRLCASPSGTMMAFPLSSAFAS